MKNGEEVVTCIEKCWKEDGDLIKPGTHRGTNIKVKIETLWKNQKCILVIALNPKILYMRLLTARLNRTLMKKIINMNDKQKCTKYQEI